MTTSTASVVHHRWSDTPAEQINPSISRQFICGERVTIARFELMRGGVVPRHSHENEQVSYIVSGALKFVLDDREIVVRGGELIQIAPNVPHSAVVVEDCVAIDVFSPVRQDWIDKTDTYFKR
jgi:quercetin dioxygenase-like cupin family protein